MAMEDAIQRWVEDTAGMAESDLLRYIALGMIASGVCAAVALMVLQAPYGRYQERGGSAFGFAMDGRLAWILQEAPSFLWPAVSWYSADSQRFTPAGKVLLGLYLLHYTNRTLVFPLRMRGGKPTPVGVFLLAFAFCLVNGYLQSRFLTRYASISTEEWFSNPQSLAGVLLFFAGMYINIDADAILRGLRRGPDDKGYYVPMGGMFDFVSGANFFGEIVEWAGYAIAGGFRVELLAFALFTALNIGPRAIHHHQDYLKRFSGKDGKPLYPADRKALVPFLL